MKKIYENLDWADLWQRDGIRVIDPPGFLETLEVDMSQARALIDRCRQEGFKLTYTHIFVRATALVLSRQPRLHQLVVGDRRYYPPAVDIGLSVANDTFLAPVIILKNADSKNLKELAMEIIARTEEVRAQHRKTLEWLRQWGWLVPFGFLRRWFCRLSMQKYEIRRDNVGTFQITCLPNVDTLMPFLFYSSAILGVGSVKERAVVRDGQVVACPTVILSCCADHKVWDGASAAKFLTELAKVLESGELKAEI
jgi:pyruvate/2-oxoglutarate dehydrogenase complex dihydrolipoamide acyltransferase (E2) component